MIHIFGSHTFGGFELRCAELQFALVTFAIGDVVAHRRIN
jgi:hypothetical protein